MNAMFEQVFYSPVRNPRPAFRASSVAGGRIATWSYLRTARDSKHVDQRRQGTIRSRGLITLHCVNTTVRSPINIYAMRIMK